MDVHDLPGAIAQGPSHCLVPPSIDGTPVHRRRDGVVPGDQCHVIRRPDPYVGEVGFGALERGDLRAEMMFPDIIQADVAHAVLAENDVLREQRFERHDN